MITQYVPSPPWHADPEVRFRLERAFYRDIWIKGETDLAMKGKPQLYASPAAVREAYELERERLRKVVHTLEIHGDRYESRPGEDRFVFEDRVRSERRLKRLERMCAPIDFVPEKKGWLW